MRQNKFDGAAPTPQARRKLSAEQVKTLYIERADKDDSRELQTKMTISVNDLKRKIESLYGLSNNSLQNIPLRVLYGGMNAPRLITKEAESLFENNIKNFSKIIFGLEENRGGIINKNKI